MLKKILVPLDGSPLAEGMLRYVRRLLLRHDAEAVLLHVLRRLPPADYRSTGAVEAELARRRMGDLQRELTEAGADVRVAFMAGDPADEILKFADAWQPSVVAMSTHGAGGPLRMLHGSVAEHVLQHADAPLLLCNPNALAPEGTASRSTIRRILVPTDASDESARILPLVEDLARVYDSEIVLCYIAAVYPDPAEYPVRTHLPTSADAREVVERFARRLSPNGPSVRTRVDFGLPETLIVQAAREEDVDLIAMTTHGRSGFARLVLGSVAESILRSSPCPTLIVRTPRRESESSQMLGAAKEARS